QMGTRSVQYSYPEMNGVYLLQYFNTPQPIPSGRADAVYDRVAALLNRDCKPGQSSQHSISMAEGTARQIDYTKLPFKAEGAPADSCACVRLFASGKHLYMIGAFGRKAWLSSPVVADYLNSLAI